jgi:hypothetical protein
MARPGDEQRGPRVPSDAVTDERWEGDETGSGISDGEAFAPPIRALLEEMALSDWNTEQPEAHLEPHLQRWLARGNTTLRLRRVANESGVLVIELEAPGTDRPALREHIYPLIATIAEPTTVIVERELPAEHRFDVTLAIVPWQNTRFPKGHGHLVRFRVAVED